MNQQPRTEVARRAQGQHSPQRRRITPGGGSAVRVTVAWKPSRQFGASVAPTEFELVAALQASPLAQWASDEHFASTWLEKLISASCSEVVLTARLGDDPHAKHRVLELAELLTLKLTATQPLIRVRFLPAGSARHREGRAA